MSDPVKPALSVAVALTVVVPMLKTLPDAGFTTTVGVEAQLSEAFTTYDTAVLHCPGWAATVILAGQPVMTGATLSTAQLF